jgi:hypothetical protein
MTLPKGPTRRAMLATPLDLSGRPVPPAFAAGALRTGVTPGTRSFRGGCGESLG